MTITVHVTSENVVTFPHLLQFGGYKIQVLSGSVFLMSALLRSDFGSVCCSLVHAVRGCSLSKKQFMVVFDPQLHTQFLYCAYSSEMLFQTVVLGTACQLTSTPLPTKCQDKMTDCMFLNVEFIPLD
jgi:hypothetical protein